ncbi:MAG: hypothetical protein QOK30_2559, partial [Nocardioidaceae bacterium]|nr:hypothetical protein [Nocardioidaceae bacterium]
MTADSPNPAAEPPAPTPRERSGRTSRLVTVCMTVVLVAGAALWAMGAS